MAINKEVFRVRALSSLFFVIAMLAGLLWDHWSFLVLLSIIHFGCWWEYTNLIGRIHQTSFHAFTRLGMALTGFAIMLAFCGEAYQVAGYGIRQNLCFPLSVAGFLLMVIGVFKQTSPVKLQAFVAAAAGWVYISLSWGFMMSLRQENISFKGSRFGF